MRVIYVAVFTFLISTLSVGAEDATPGSKGAFRLIIHKSGNYLKNINMASGHGADVQFFSNLDDLSIDWDADSEEGGPVRTGTYTPANNGNTVVLGVCAGGTCDVSRGGSFTTQVGNDSLATD